MVKAALLMAIETSGTKGSIALAEKEANSVRLLSATAWDKKATHSEASTAAAEHVLRDCGKTLSDVTHFAVNVGPGSFTGIRVGLNMARTLAFSLNRPLAGFTALELLARRESAPGDSVFVAIKAIQNFYYVAGYERKEDGLVERLAPASCTENELALASANATKVLIEGQTPGFSPELSATELAEFALSNVNSARFSSWHSTIPLYIRASQAEEKLGQKR
jgi:tRNA threonylcarbamoyl adenosine modification protein YeaZ